MDKATPESFLKIAQQCGIAHNGGAGGEYLLCATSDQLLKLFERLAAQSAPTEPEYNPLLIDGVQHDPLCLKVYRSPLKECDCGAQAAQTPVVQAGERAQAVRMLTDGEIDAITDMHNTGRSQGAYDCAIELLHKFCAVNGLRIPADGKIGDAA